MIVHNFREYLKEAVYVGKIGLESYKFIYDTFSMSAFFELETKESGNVKVELKGDGEIFEEGFDTFRIFSPENIPFAIKDISEKVVYILNKNRLGYKFTLKSVVKPKYGLQPYSLLTCDSKLKMESFEKLTSSTKQVNAKVKKSGGFDQFTF